MSDNTWIKELKAGDVVYVSGKYGDTPSRYKVGRLTNTRIIVDIGKNLSGETIEMPFRKDTGWLIGGYKWSPSYLIQATQEVEAKYRLHKINIEARERLEKLRGTYTFTVQEALDVLDFCTAMENRLEKRLQEAKI